MQDHEMENDAAEGYEPPMIVVLGGVDELTQGDFGTGGDGIGVGLS